MSHIMLTEIGAVVMGLAISAGLLVWLQESREAIRLLRLQKRRCEIKIRHGRKGNIHQLSKDLSAC